MGAGRKTQTIIAHEHTSWPAMQDSKCFSARKLCKKDLCGVIFGCTHETMNECLSKKLFGLPYGHMCYVSNIKSGMPLFLFNYSDRKLHGIYEAASQGKANLDASAWAGGFQGSPFPAQVRIRTRIQCEALVENQFKKIIEKNYYTLHHFWFELDGAQTRDLVALFKPSRPPSSVMLAPVTLRGEIPPVTAADRSVALSKQELPQALRLTYKDVVSQKLQNVKDLKQSNDRVNGNKFASLQCDDADSEINSPVETLSDVLADVECKEPVSDWEDLLADNVENVSFSSGASCEGASNTSMKQQHNDEALKCEDKRILQVLDNMAAEHEHLTSYSNGFIHNGGVCYTGDIYKNNGLSLDELSILAKKTDHLSTSYIQHGSVQEMKKPHECYSNGDADIVEYLNASDLDPGTIELVTFIKELKEWAEDVKNSQVESNRQICQLRNQLWCSDRKIGMLEDRVKELELKIDPSKLVDESLDKFVKQYLGSEDVVYLIGGFDGCSWLSALDSFSPSLDIITPLKSMNAARSYASAVALDGNLFVFGGRSESLWSDTVEYYNRRHDEWISCPSMLRKKGSLCGVTLNGKIYTIGGGDSVECLSDVETFDPVIGKWVTNRPMLCKRFASAAAELKGAICAVGGYDGKQYLRSAERFDPREGFWTSIPSLNTTRGSHALAVLNEKLYCIGGYDGQKMSSSVEIFDPRLNSWVMGEPMKFVRGYAAAAVLGNSLFAIGGIDDQTNIVDTVECYKEGVGWSSSGWRAIGKRCFFSAIVL